MVGLLGTVPDFEYYNIESATTKVVKEYWETKSLGGGPLTGPMEMEADKNEVSTPLESMINTVENFGYFEMKRIQSSRGQPHLLYDVWILATQVEDLGRLLDLTSYVKAPICCFWHGEGWGVARHLNGVARVIGYQDHQASGSKPSSALRMWEGQVAGGLPMGFGRAISGEDDYAFVGYLDSLTTTMKGTGAYFTGLALKHTGIYDNHVEFYAYPPTELATFTAFTNYSNAPACGPREVQSLAGICRACAPYKHPDLAGRACITEEGMCELSQILNPDGRCRQCPLYSYPDGQGLRCLDDRAKCTRLQILRTSGKCESCPAYSHPDLSRTKCESDKANCT